MSARFPMSPAGIIQSVQLRKMYIFVIVCHQAKAPSVFGHKISAFQAHQQNANYPGSCSLSSVAEDNSVKKGISMVQVQLPEPEETNVRHCFQQVPKLDPSRPY